MREPACKPGSVKNSHSSRPDVTIWLEQPTRIPRGPRVWIPIWSCSRWGFPCHVMLPCVRCALTAPFHPYLLPKQIWRYIFCGTFRRLAPPRRYLAPCPLEPGLSSPGRIRRRLSSQLSRARCYGSWRPLARKNKKPGFPGLMFNLIRAYSRVSEHSELAGLSWQRTCLSRLMHLAS